MLFMGTRHNPLLVSRRIKDRCGIRWGEAIASHKISERYYLRCPFLVNACMWNTSNSCAATCFGKGGCWLFCVYSVSRVMLVLGVQAFPVLFTQGHPDLLRSMYTLLALVSGNLSAAFPPGTSPLPLPTPPAITLTQTKKQRAKDQSRVMCLIILNSIYYFNTTGPKEQQVICNLTYKQCPESRKQ